MHCNYIFYKKFSLISDNVATIFADQEDQWTALSSPITRQGKPFPDIKCHSVTVYKWTKTDDQKVCILRFARNHAVMFKNLSIFVLESLES